MNIWMAVVVALLLILVRRLGIICVELAALKHDMQRSSESLKSAIEKVVHLAEFAISQSSVTNEGQQDDEDEYYDEDEYTGLLP